MTLEYRTPGEGRDKTTVKVKNHIYVTDADGNRYRIGQGKFGGLEILVEDGSAVIEPRVANELVIKTSY